jgi:hypothetical protein
VTNAPWLDYLDILDQALGHPQMKHLHIDISWDETAKYVARPIKTGSIRFR